MSTVIAAIDSTVAAKPVLAMAAAIAPYFGARIEAVHVPDDGEQTAQSEAEHAGVVLRRLEGDPVEQISRAVAEQDVVALVIGARGHAAHHGVGHLPIALASGTDKPVVVVQPSATPPERLCRVLVAIEGTSKRAKELKRAVEVIESTGLETTVVHVDEEERVPRFSDQLQHETDAYADSFFARFLPGLKHARLDLRMGNPTDEILAAANDTQAELLAIGWPPASEERRGRIARELLERSPVPVLLVAIA